MYGLPADTVRKKFRTRIVRENSINPVYGDDPFVFKKVVLPHLASIRIAAYEENGKFLGHRVLPVIGLCPGYRHVSLRNELGQPLPLSTLFLCIIVKDYVPDGLSDFAEALANPIKYQSDLEKRSQQLAVLQEDMEPISDDGESCKEQSSVGTLKKEIKPSDTATSSPKHRSSFGPSTVHSTSAAESTNLAESLSNIDSNFTSGSLNVNIGPNSAVYNLSQSNESSKVATLPRSQPEIVTNEADDIVAETLEKILEHKSIREKRETLEKKIRLLKKNHDKKKVEIVQNEISDGKKSSINKLVKKLSSKNM